MLEEDNLVCRISIGCCVKGERKSEDYRKWQEVTPDNDGKPRETDIQSRNRCQNHTRN